MSAYLLNDDDVAPRFLLVIDNQQDYINCVLIKTPSVTIRTQDCPRSISLYCVLCHPRIEVGLIDACV